MLTIACLNPILFRVNWSGGQVIIPLLIGPFVGAIIRGVSAFVKERARSKGQEK